MTGNESINGTGNSLNNIMKGNAGDNILKGGLAMTPSPEAMAIAFLVKLATIL
ncbi:hypothetical protein [Chroococcidiopsis sp. SAG 2025]|uniref:hypothetical protein n=1 Tax=Chroococcidiopsis sp. SAG 2025 TaxID=171389 RepID=UPI0029373575|nr:hypothetical protein [Chroococcidiopsis sp. SAG 2025]